MRITVLATTAMIGACTLTGTAGAGSGTTGAQVIEILPEARASAMGETFTAVADDMGAMWYNPAGLGAIGYTQMQTAHNSWPSGIIQQFAGVAFDLQEVRTANVIDLGAVAFSWLSLDPGAIESRDAAGLPAGGFSADSRVLSVAYGKGIAGDPQYGQLLAGVGFKQYREDLGGTVAEGNAVDAGLLWNSGGRLYSLGVAALNMGARAKYASVESDLPFSVRAGVSGRFLEGRVLGAFDAVRRGDDGISYHAGTEIRLAEALVLRAGYDSRNDAGSGVTMGTGLSLSEIDAYFMFAQEISLDYAFVPFGDLGDVHRLAFTVKLGPD